jgi:hypothetical protein
MGCYIYGVKLKWRQVQTQIAIIRPIEYKLFDICGLGFIQLSIRLTWLVYGLLYLWSEIQVKMSPNSNNNN